MKSNRKLTAAPRFLTGLLLLGSVLAIQPSILSAQTSGVGTDGYTRFLWRGTDGSAAIWKVNSTLGSPVSIRYGPYNGYTPVALAVGSNNNSYILWQNTNGSMVLWELGPNLNFIANTPYGPYTGWLAESISVSEDGSNQLRVIWRETDGQMSIWAMNANLTQITSAVFGPFFGYEPGAEALESSKTSPDSESATRAAIAMAQAAVSAPMPQ